MSLETTLNAKAVDLAKLSYEMTAAAGSGHPTSAASLTHLVTVLMYNHMRWEPQNPSHAGSDRLVLSEGHACPIIYAACADMGVMIGHDKDSWRAMTREDALTLRELDSVVDGHPNPIEGFPFFDAATGSLGQGLSVAAGLAQAAKINGSDKRIFCIMGDGEAREGQVWEAIDFIIDEGLKSVCPIFNANVYAQSDKASHQQSAETLAAKLDAANFEALVIDGHEPLQVLDALKKHTVAQANPDAKPVAIVAKTVKGWGAASQQGHGHHGKPATGDDLTTALEELDKTGRELGAHADTPLQIPMMSPTQRPTPEVGPAVPFTKACEQFELGKIIEAGKCATRRAYGIALRAAGHRFSNVVALDADVKNSTHSEDFFKDAKLTDRFVECRIAEQNMVSVAAGMAAANKIPFASTFAKFLTRAYDQIEMAVNSGANIKLVGSHAGASLGADGPSQMGMPDVAWFRAFSTAKTKDGTPLFYVLQPSDAYAAYALTMAMAEHDGPCYMRVHRPGVEFLYGDADQFTLGGHQVLSEGRDLMIAASGYMVHYANQALDLLDEQGIDATLVDLYSLPFDEEAILDLINENNGMVLTLEDNYGGGIGSAIADVVAEAGDGFTVHQMHVRGLPKSAKSGDAMLAHLGLSPEEVAKQAMGMLELTGA